MMPFLIERDVVATRGARRAQMTASTPVPAMGLGRSCATRKSHWLTSSAAVALSTET